MYTWNALKQRKRKFRGGIYVSFSTEIKLRETMINKDLTGEILWLL